MLKRIIDKLNSINNFSKRVIFAGAIISIALCIVGLGIVTYNENFLQKISMYTIGTSLIYSAITVFSQFTIGGLIIDIANSLFKNHSD